MQAGRFRRFWGEGKTVSAIYNFVPDESLRQLTLNSLASVTCAICEICGYLLAGNRDA
jgi:hypothetical protein